MRLQFSVIFLCLLLAACGTVNQSIEVADGETVEGNVSTVNGAIRVGSNSKVTGEVSNVNGPVDIGPDSEVGSVANVNGSIRLAQSARAGSLETVNGSLDLSDGSSLTGSASAVNGKITAGKEVRIDGDMTSVNGELSLDIGSTVAGRMSNVNGDISLRTAQVGSLETSSGSIYLSEGTTVESGIHVKAPPRGDSSRNIPRVVIGKDVRVGGAMQFDREVELLIHESAIVGEINGAEPTRFSGDRPPDQS